MTVDPATPPAPTAEYFPVRGNFTDGIRTSGQQVPIYSEIRSYEEFPDVITGPTVWKAEDYQCYPERWTHVFSEVEINEISTAAEQFRAAGTPLIHISKVFTQTLLFPNGEEYD